MSCEAALDKQYRLSEHHIRDFRANGFIRLPNVLRRDTLKHIQEHCTSVVRQHLADSEARVHDDAYGRAFIHVMNVWTRDNVVKELSFSRRLAEIAAKLLGVRGVRISHDQALFKKAGGDATPIHADQYHWPVSNDMTITAWIPLQDTSLAMGPLAFYEGSHFLEESLRVWLSTIEQEAVREYFSKSPLVIKEEPFAAGEVSFHYGWIFHRTGINSTDSERKAFAVIYMDENIRLTEPRDGSSIEALFGWCPGARVGDFLNSPLNPVVYRLD